MHGGVNRSESAGAAIRPNITLAAKQWLTPHGMSGMDHTGKRTDLPSRRGGASLSHAAQTGEFSHSSPQAQPIPDGQESSPLPPGSPLPSASKANTTPRLLSLRLNPYFAEWLMGLPLGWTSQDAPTVCGKLEMEWYRSRQRQLLSSWLGERDGG